MYGKLTIECDVTIDMSVVSLRRWLKQKLLTQAKMGINMFQWCVHISENR